MTVRRALQYAVPLVAITLLGAWFATGPLYATYSIEQCRGAYADARTRGDTARVDLHPLRNDRDKRWVRHTCGEVRATVAADSSALIPARSRD